MMNEQDGNSPAAQSQQPVLHRQPGIAGSLAPCGHKRREVVQNEKVHAIEMRLKGLLPFNTAEISAAGIRSMSFGTSTPSRARKADGFLVREMFSLKSNQIKSNGKRVSGLRASCRVCARPAKWRHLDWRQAQTRGRMDRSQCLGRMAVPLIPATVLAGPPTTPDAPASRLTTMFRQCSRDWASS
jgi:hypothetical protein